MNMKKLIAGLILLPLILFLLLVLLPIILLYGLLMMILRKPVTFSYGQYGFPGTQQQKQDDDVIDVEVIHSENTGEQNDLSGRSLR